MSGSETEDSVVLNVKWKPHPLNEHGVEEVWGFKLTRTDNLRELFEAVAEDASVLSNNLILTFRGSRVFPSVTPQSLGLWGSADLVACDKTTYDYVKSRSHIAATQPPVDDPSVIEIGSDTDEAPQEYEDESDAGGGGADSESEGDTFKLILRSALTSRDITLTVRPTTKCGAIVKAFLKKAGLPDKYTNSPKKRKSIGGKSGPDPRLCIDGDKVANDVEIGEMDLEDGDLVEVVGL